MASSEEKKARMRAIAAEMSPSPTDRRNAEEKERKAATKGVRDRITETAQMLQDRYDDYEAQLGSPGFAKALLQTLAPLSTVTPPSPDSRDVRGTIAKPRNLALETLTPRQRDAGGMVIDGVPMEMVENEREPKKGGGWLIRKRWQSLTAWSDRNGKRVIHMMEEDTSASWIRVTTETKTNW